MSNFLDLLDLSICSVKKSQGLSYSGCHKYVPNERIWLIIKARWSNNHNRKVGQGEIDDVGEVLTDLAGDLVPEDDIDRFLKIAHEEIAALHEGNFARYRLRPGEFLAWQKRKTQ